MNDQDNQVENRRNFLQKIVGGGAVATVAATAAVLSDAGTSTEAREHAGKQYGMLIDTRRCIGCQQSVSQARNRNDSSRTCR